MTTEKGGVPVKWYYLIEFGFRWVLVFRNYGRSCSFMEKKRIVCIILIVIIFKKCHNKH